MSCIPCNKCGQIHEFNDPCFSSTCTSGCPILLDFSCVIYHKNNNQISALGNLGLSNGATLQLFAETVDQKIKDLNILSTPLPYLRSKYIVNTVPQALIAIDTELPLLKVWRGNVVVDPAAPDDGWYWYRSDVDQLKIRLNGSTRIISIT